MKREQIIAKLKEIGFYQEEFIEEILQKGRIIHLQASDYHIEEGKFFKAVPIILKGHLRVFKGSDEAKEVLLYYLNPLQACPLSISSAYRDNKSLVSSIATEETIILSIPIQELDPWMRYKSWRKFIMVNVIDAYREIVELYTQVVFKKLDERIINYLKKRVLATQSNILQLSHEEIAKEMGTSREVISRVLKRLEQLDKIALGHRSIQLIN